MTTAITTKAQLNQLSACQAEQRMNQVILAVQHARTFDEISGIKDFGLQMEAYLRTRAAAVQLGDQIEALRIKARELRLECELRQGTMTATLASRERAVVLKDLGITPIHAAACERAATLPRPTINAVLRVQQAKREPVRAEHLAALVPLSRPERVAVVAKLGDVPTIREAVARIIPEYRPAAPPKTAAAPAKVDPTLLRALASAQQLRAATNTMVLLLERAIQTNPAKVRAELLSKDKEIGAAYSAVAKYVGTL